MSANEIIYKSASGIYENTAEVQVTLDGTNTPLAGVTRITCQLSGGELIDSAVSTSAITWIDEGVITFDFAEHTFSETPVGRQHAMLVAYDPIHPDGQVVAHKQGEDNRLAFTFVNSL